MNEFRLQFPRIDQTYQAMELLETKKGGVKQVISNLIIALMNPKYCLKDRIYEGHIFYDTFAKEIKFQGRIIGEQGIKPGQIRLWDDALNNRLGLEIEKRFGINYNASKMWEVIRFVASQYSISPPKQYLKQLVWEENEDFDYMIDELKDKGLIKETQGINDERDDLINIVGHVGGGIEVLTPTNNKGESFKVVNFSVVSEDEKGEKTYHSCSANEDKAKLAHNFKKGDFVKVFGKVRRRIDENGKEHKNVRVFDSKLLKAREKGRGQEEKKGSILGAIKAYKEEEKTKETRGVGGSKEKER